MVLFSISDIDSSRELLGKSNVRTFLYENEFSAIGVWLIPPSDTDASYYAAAAHWFGFETPAVVPCPLPLRPCADRIPTTGQAVYGGIAVGDFRQARFRFADTDSDPLTPLDETVTVESYYVFGGAQFEADFATSEMDGQFELSAYDPQEAYGNPFLLLSAEPLDTLIVNWEGQILPDGGGFANNVDPVTETVRAVDPNTGMPLTDSSNNPIMRTRDTFAPAGTISSRSGLQVVQKSAFSTIWWTLTALGAWIPICRLQLVPKRCFPFLENSSVRMLMKSPVNCAYSTLALS